MTRLLPVVAISLLILFVGFGCTTHKPHSIAPDLPPDSAGKLPTQPPFDPRKSKNCHSDNQSCTYIVEFDEFGKSFNRAQFQFAINQAKDTAAQNGVVLVYVHGWHHSAALGDSDLKHFTSTLDQLHEQLNIKVTGIYVGWRGDSINVHNSVWGLSSYVLTFWNRKATAHTVGNGGGVSELIRILSDIRADNLASHLIIVGHSFGGAIVYSSVSQILSEQIRQDADKIIITSPQQIENYAFNPIADLVVLLNPAFEAMRMAPLYAQARSYEYKPKLPPRLVIITSTADWSTNFFFPAGRFLGTLFKGYPGNYYGNLDRTAIGHYVPFITHQLVVEKCPLANGNTGASLLDTINPKDKTTEKTICFNTDQPDRALVLTRCDCAKDCNTVTLNHFITRGLAAEGYIPNRFPIANIRTNSSFITSHTDIWNKKVQLFLRKLLMEAITHPGNIPMEQKKSLELN